MAKDQPPDLGYKCTKCKDKGYTLSKDESGYEYSEECECALLEKANHLLKQSGLEKMVHDSNFSTFRYDYVWQGQMFSKAQEYLFDNKKGNWFFIGGKVGAGKTHLCTAICYEFIKGCMRTIYMPYREAFSVLKRMLSANARDEFDHYLQSLKTTEVLYIDDLFKCEKGKLPTSWEIEMIYEIIDSRYRNSELKTIISSELNINQVLEIDEAIGSRIYERSKFYNIILSEQTCSNIRLNPLKVQK